MIGRLNDVFRLITLNKQLNQKDNKMRLKEFLTTWKPISTKYADDVIKRVNGPPPPKVPAKKGGGDEGPTGFTWEILKLTLRGVWQGDGFQHLPAPYIYVAPISATHGDIETHVEVPGKLDPVPRHELNYPPEYRLDVKFLRGGRWMPWPVNTQVTDEIYEQIANELYDKIMETNLTAAESHKHLIEKPTGAMLKKLHENQIAEHEKPGEDFFRSV
jgi:hypothetical protein